MGEAKAKSRKRDEILRAEARCIYCLAEPTTVEHMPPRSMFALSHRLSGMEYAACQKCNYDTRAADTAAGFLARIAPSSNNSPQALSESLKLLRTLTDIAPKFVGEFFGRSPKHVWSKGRDAIYGRKVVLTPKGEAYSALVLAFGAKLGMALYREHVGKPLPENGLVFSRHFLNSSLTYDQVRAYLSILPEAGQLRQGRISSGRSFNYRYNTDGNSILAAFVAFHDNLFFMIFSTDDVQIQKLLIERFESQPVTVGGLGELSYAWSSKAESQLP